MSEIKGLEYWADRLKAHENLCKAFSMRFFKARGLGSNISFMNIMDSSYVDRRVLKDCRLSCVPWLLFSN